METPKKIDRRVVMAGLAAVVLSAAAALMMQPALAQANGAQTRNMTAVPDLGGSVNIRDAMSDLVRDSVKVSFTDAAATAQEQVENGAVVGGKLATIQGYLVYSFRVVDYDAGTSRVVIVDAGNGQVLYTSDDVPMHEGFGPGRHFWAR